MELKEFFLEHRKCALAFSGGADSAYLLYAAMKAGVQVTAYYAKTAFQPEFEFEDACRLAKELGADMKILNLDVLAESKVACNPADRCYYCKTCIFTNIRRAAAEDGYEVLLDGTNASDPESERPGMKALREINVMSPLRMCGLTKPEIRQLSKEAGLFTWNKPAYACLATRIPAGTAITQEALKKTEQAENYMMKLGFSDFRIRMGSDGSALLQLREEQIPMMMKQRKEISGYLKTIYPGVLLDLIHIRKGETGIE